MGKLLKSIREFFWPILEGESQEPKLIERDDFCCEDNEIDYLLKVAQDYQTGEENRRKEVESKASIFIGTFSVAATIMLSLMKDFMLQGKNAITYIQAIIITIMILYLCRAICFSIKALSRKNYSVVGFPKYLLNSASSSNNTLSEKKRKILIQMINNTRKNQVVINDKVDQMVMAQLFFKRAVVCVCLLAVFVLIKPLIGMIHWGEIDTITINTIHLVIGVLSLELAIFLGMLLAIMWKLNKFSASFENFTRNYELNKDDKNR